ncbi:MAG: hypothetical protein JWN95_1746 [Frankiales bacterium]|nr:hypothetical protein [Frankiales bacterium]
MVRRRPAVMPGASLPLCWRRCICPEGPTPSSCTAIHKSPADQAEVPQPARRELAEDMRRGGLPTSGSTQVAPARSRPATTNGAPPERGGHARTARRCRRARRPGWMPCKLSSLAARLVRLCDPTGTTTAPASCLRHMGCPRVTANLGRAKDRHCTPGSPTRPPRRRGAPRGTTPASRDAAQHITREQVVGHRVSLRERL